MRVMTALPIVALTACTAQPPHAIATRAAGSCIELSQVTARHVAPPSSVIFETTHGTYRAELLGNCAARATANDIVETVSQSTELCRDDRVRVFDPVEAKATGSRSFPQCRIGSITAVPAA
ncbi:MAG TPA: hypothetical protein VF098_11690 [Sphingomicrobium sp.]